MELLFITLTLLLIGFRRFPTALLLICNFLYADWIVGSGLSTFIVEHNYIDIGIFLTICMMLVLYNFRKKTKDRELLPLKQGIILLLLFFLSAIIIDLTVNHVALTSVIKVFRLWSLLFMIWFVRNLSLNDINKFLRYLLYFSVALSAIFIFEQLFGIELTGARHTAGGSRAPLPWPPALLIFILLLNDYYRQPTYIRYLCIAIIGTNLVLCGSRSFFISYVFAVFFYIIWGKFNRRKLILTSAAAIAVAFILSTENILTKRFEASEQDIESLQSNSGQVEGNLSFRLLMLQERFEYICKSPQRIIWGLGCVQEKDFHKKVFQLGLKNENGETIQLDTGDISWTLLLIRLGIAGTALYLIFFVGRFFLLLLRNRRNIIARSTFFYVIINTLFLSFTYPFLSNSFFWFIPIILLRKLISPISQPALSRPTVASPA